MAIEVGDIVARLKADTSQFSAGLNQANKKLDEFGKSAQDTSSKLSALFTSGLVTAAGAVLTSKLTMPMLGFASSAIQAADSLEQATIAYETMLGSGEAAQRMLTDMKKFAATTPFEFPDLLEAGKRLTAMGFAAEDIIPTMRNVGNAVAGVGGGKAVMDRLILAMGQINAKGQLMSQEMRQLAESGIPAWEFLSKYLNVTVAEAMDMVTKKQVSGAEALFAIQSGMAGRFGGMMEKQSKTLTGIWSNLQDTLGFILMDIGQEIVKTFNIKEVLVSVREYAETFMTWFKALDDGTRRTVMILAAAFAASGPILVVVGAFMAAMTVVTAPMLVTGAIITGIIAGVAAIAASWDTLKEKSTVLSTAMMAATNAVAFLKNTLGALHDAAEKLFVRLGAMIAVVELVGKQLFSTSAMSKEAWTQTLEQVKAIDKWAAAELKAIDIGKNATHVQMEVTQAVKGNAEATNTAANSVKKSAEVMAAAHQRVKEAVMERMDKEIEMGQRQREFAKDKSKEIFSKTFEEDAIRMKNAYAGSAAMIENVLTKQKALKDMADDIAKGNKAMVDAEIRGAGAYQEALGRSIVERTQAEQLAEGRSQEDLGRFIVRQEQARQAMQFGWSDVFGSMSQSAQFAFGSIRASFANTIADMAQGTASWRDFWLASQRALITSTVNWGIEVVGKFIAKNAMILATEGATAAGVTSIWTATSAAVLGAFGAMSAGIATFFTATIVPMFTAVGTAVMTFLSSLAAALDISIFGAPFSIPVWAAVGLVAAAVGVISAFAFGAFAEGGIVKGPMMGLVGEAGPEAIIPLDQLSSIMGTGGPTTITVELDGRTIARSVFDNMPSIMRVRGISA